MATRLVLVPSAISSMDMRRLSVTQQQRIRAVKINCVMLEFQRAIIEIGNACADGGAATAAEAVGTNLIDVAIQSLTETTDCASTILFDMDDFNESSEITATFIEQHCLPEMKKLLPPGVKVYWKEMHELYMDWSIPDL